VSAAFALLRPLLFRLDAETAHALTMKLLRAANFLPARRRPDDPRLKVQAFGLSFDNPVGMAAGFDKHGEAPDALLQLGFGFVEIGTVTPLPQPGNPRPRLFRLVEDEAVINRFGFNSEGHAAVRRRLERQPGFRGPVGINVGANKEAVDRVADYVAGVRAFAGLASFFTINISSPNTPGLRDLQHARELDALLARVGEARAQAAPQTPVLLKIAPDLSLAELDEVIRVARERRIDGMIVSNTTIARPPGLRSRHAGEAGGLSGKPLREPATRMLAQAYLRVEGQFPLIGVGGVHDAASAVAKIEAGASLVQLYSALVFGGPALLGRIKLGLADHVERAGAPDIAACVGVRAADYARDNAHKDAPPDR